MNYIEIKDEDGVRLITLSREKALNALNPDMIQEIGEAVNEVSKMQDCFGIVITGAGEKAFAAGADIKGFSTLTQEQAYHLSKSGSEIFRQLELSGKPIIAAVNGYALGGGLELAMACHMRIGSENAVFGLPEVKLGLIPGYGGTQRLTTLIGKAKAMEYILTADMMDAAEAHRLGLINHIATDGKEAVSLAKKTILRIAKRGPGAIHEAIQLIDLGTSGESLEIALEKESQIFAERMLSEECKEGVKAFIEKREPKFRQG